MNRRSFIKGILAACVAPAVLVPKLSDHARWRVSRRKGLYIAEFKYVCMSTPCYKEPQEMLIFHREGPPHHFEPNPDFGIAHYELQHRFKSQEYINQMQGRWSFKEWHGPPSQVLADCST